MTKKPTKKPKPKPPKVVEKAAPIANGKSDVAVSHTVVSPPSQENRGTHAEELMAIQQGNKDYGGAANLRSESGNAILRVDVPAHQKDVVLAFSQIPGCAIAAVQAWDAVRGVDDAPFASCVMNHQMKLVSHAESIYQGGPPMLGDTMFAKFEREVARIKSEQDKEKP